MARMSKGNGKAKKPGKNTGVEHDDEGPVYIEELTAEEKSKVADKLARACQKKESLESDWRVKSAEHRGEMKEIKKQITTLTEQHITGTKKVPAQQNIPGTTEASAEA